MVAQSGPERCRSDDAERVAHRRPCAGAAFSEAIEICRAGEDGTHAKYAEACSACAAQIALRASEDPVPAPQEGWIRDPDSIPKSMIDACAQQIQREFGLFIGSAGYYKRIIAATLAAAPLPPTDKEGA